MVRPGPFAVLVVAMLSAACVSRPPPDGPTTTSTAIHDSCSGFSTPTFSAASGFSGDNAFAHVLRQVCDFTKDPPRENYRTPGTPERQATGRYLHGALQAAGWSAWYQNFTGRDYDALEKGSVAAYARDPPYCTAAKKERMLDLAFSNVGADLGAGDRVWLLMAHYDSKLAATSERDPANQVKPVLGTNDGASGVAVLVEAARVLAARSPGDALRILLVDGEDGFEDCHPLAGSIHYARALGAAERDRIAGVLLLDMVGDPEARFCLAGDAQGLADRLRAAARNESVSSVADAGGCSVFDDHTAFVDAGVPGIDLIDFARPGTGFPPYWHTTRDTPDKVAAARLGEVGRVVVATFG